MTRGSAWPPSALIGVEAITGRTPPGLRLNHAGKQSSTISFVGGSDADVQAAITQIDLWRANPALAPRARDHQSTPALIAETAAAAVLMRLKTAPALLVVGSVGDRTSGA